MTREQFWALEPREQGAAWAKMSPAQKDAVRDLSGLTRQLLDLEGWRVEVDTMAGETRRFYVGRSTGWRPCHLEVLTRRSMGGDAADKQYRAVRPLYQRNARRA